MICNMDCFNCPYPDCINNGYATAKEIAIGDVEKSTSTYYSKNKEHCLKVVREYQDRNREKLREYSREYYQKHKKSKKEYQKNRYNTLKDEEWFKEQNKKKAHEQYIRRKKNAFNVISNTD